MSTSYLSIILVAISKLKSFSGCLAISKDSQLCSLLKVIFSCSNLFKAMSQQTVDK